MPGFLLRMDRACRETRAFFLRRRNTLIHTVFQATLSQLRPHFLERLFLRIPRKCRPPARSVFDRHSRHAYLRSRSVFFYFHRIDAPIAQRSMGGGQRLGKIASFLVPHLDHAIERGDRWNDEVPAVVDAAWSMGTGSAP